MICWNPNRFRIYENGYSVYERRKRYNGLTPWRSLAARVLSSALHAYGVIRLAII